MLPILLSAFAFNFNNFYLIYLLTGGGPAQEGRLATAQATDILISWAYKTAFSAEGQSAYGLGAAISLLIFAITVAEFLAYLLSLVFGTEPESLWQVREVSAKYFAPEKQSIVVVGDPAAVGEQLKQFGEFTVTYGTLLEGEREKGSRVISPAWKPPRISPALIFPEVRSCAALSPFLSSPAWSFWG